MILFGACLGIFMPGEQPALPQGQAAAAAVPKNAAPDDRPAAKREQPKSGWRSETKLHRGQGGHFRTKALVNGKAVEFIIDTGASTVALTMADARRIGIPVNPAAFEIVGMGAGGPVRGQEILLDSVSLDGRQVRALHGVVLEGLEESLLGQSFLGEVGEVTMSGGVMILR